MRYDDHTRGGALYKVRWIENKMSMEELSKRSGVSVAHISNIELGRVNMGDKIAFKLGRALHTHPGYLLYPELPWFKTIHLWMDNIN